MFDPRNQTSLNELREHEEFFAYWLMLLSIVLIMTPLVCRLLRGKFFAVSPQLVGMLLGIIVVLAANAYSPEIDFNELPERNPEWISIYYTLMITKFVYSSDAYNLVKALLYSLIISIIEWAWFVISFGFLVITFSGSLNTITIMQVCVIGAIFTPIEVPSVLFTLVGLKHSVVMMTTWSVLSSIFSFIAIKLVVGIISNMYSEWYQLVFVLLYLLLLSMVIGTCCGLFAGYCITRLMCSGVHTMLVIISSNFLLFHFAQYVMACNGGCCCFCYLIMISRKRLYLLPEIDRDVQTLIDSCYYIVSTLVSFIAVCGTLPIFLPMYTLMVVPVSLALYISATACRLLFFVCISPILSRFGHSFTFSSLITMVWCVKKGPLPFLLLAMVVNEDFEKIVPKELLVFGLNYAFLQNAFNELTSWTVLCRLGLSGNSSFTVSDDLRKALNSMECRMKAYIAILKMNRFYTNVNWRMIEEYIRLKLIPNQTRDINTQNRKKFENKKPFCNNCQRDVSLVLSSKGHTQMIATMRQRVLHLAKLSFKRQFEIGFLDVTSLRILNHLVDEANSSKECILKIDGVLARMQDKHLNSFVEKLRSYLLSHDNCPPHYVKKYRKCFQLMSVPYFEKFFDFITLVQTIVSIIALANYPLLTLELITVAIAVILFYIEFTIKIRGYTAVNYRDGFSRYLKRHWNRVELMLLVLNTSDLILNSINVWCNLQEPTFLTLYYGLNVLRSLRLTRTIRFCVLLPLFILLRYDHVVEVKVRCAYSVGRGVVIAYETIEEALVGLSKIASIVDEMRAYLQKDRNQLARELGVLEMTWPGITSGVKTRTAMRCINTAMVNTVNRLHARQHLNEREYHLLREVVIDQLRAICRMQPAPSVGIRAIFQEVPWINQEERLFEYLFGNVQLCTWDAGATIYTKGNIADGIILITDGMLKMLYTPSEEVLNDMRNEGLLPVRDMIRQTELDYPLDKFIFRGNTIGELSVFTGRPYCCDIIAEIPSQGYIIPSHVMMQAVNYSPDPIKGLFSRVWQYITARLVQCLLKELPVYAAVTDEELLAVIERSFVARLDAYSVFHSNENIEEMILVEGIVADHHTREIFIAPCVLPRSASTLLLPENATSTIVNSKPKIWIVPKQDADPYSVMAISEVNSQLNKAAPSNCFILGKSTALKDIQEDYSLLNELSNDSPASGNFLDDNDIDDMDYQAPSRQLSIDKAVSLIKRKRDES